MIFFRKFLSSPYFNPAALLMSSVLGGFVVALFPYNDLSVKRMMQPAVILVGLCTMCVAFIVITYVMALSYYLDKRYDWHTLHSGRYTLQIIFGGLVPLGMMVAYGWGFYGLELLQSETYYFVFALQLFMLYLINERSYMVYLGQRKKTLRTRLEDMLAERQKAESERALFLEKYALKKSQFLEVQSAKKELEEQLLDYQRRELRIKTDVLDSYIIVECFIFGAKDASPYIVKIGNKELHIEERNILGFVIEGGNHRKPFIYIKTTDGKTFLTHEESVDRIHEDRFPTYLRLNRQSLVSPRALVSYKVDQRDGGCRIQTKLADEPIFIPKNKWNSLQDRILLIFALSQKAS